MPDVGSLVVLTDGALALVTKVTPLGDDDRVRVLGESAETRVTAWDIEQEIGQ